MISITLKNKAIAGIVIFLLFSFGNPTAAFSQSARRIVSSTPAANSIIGSPSAPIVIDFDRAVELSTNYQDYVWISGNYYGYYLHKGELLARVFRSICKTTASALFSPCLSRQPSPMVKILSSCFILYFLMTKMMVPRCGCIFVL